MNQKELNEKLEVIFNEYVESNEIKYIDFNGYNYRKISGGRKAVFGGVIINIKTSLGELDSEILQIVK